MPAPRPTHFLSLSMGHDDNIRTCAQRLIGRWNSMSPPIKGLSPEILVEPRRLHLTLGIFHLDSFQSVEYASGILKVAVSRARIILEGNLLRVEFGRLGTFQKELNECHVLFISPLYDNSTNNYIESISESIRQTFHEANILQDHRRPLQVRVQVLTIQELRKLVPDLIINQASLHSYKY